MEGIVVSHVDDLLMSGSPVAIASLEALGPELAFGSLEKGSFVYCGKRISQHSDYSISIDMKEYHENLKPAVVPMHRRRTPDAPLTPDEQKKLRALLGSCNGWFPNLELIQVFSCPPYKWISKLWGLC